MERHFIYKDNDFKFNFEDKQIKYHLDFDLKCHSLYKDKSTLLKLSNKDILTTYFNQMMCTLDNNADINFKEKTITIYRALGLEKIEDLKLPLGEYWSFDFNNAKIYDDEDFCHFSDTYNHKSFVLKAKYKFSDVNWEDTLDLYMLNDFLEYEIRTNKNAIPLELHYSNTNDFNKINIVSTVDFSNAIIDDKSLSNSVVSIENDITFDDLNSTLNNITLLNKQYKLQFENNIIQEKEIAPTPQNIEHNNYIARTI